MFLILSGALSTMDALHQLLMARAIAMGEAMHKNGKDGRIKSSINALTREAFPSED